MAICPDLKIGDRELPMQAMFSRYPAIAKPVNFDKGLKQEVVLLASPGEGREAVELFSDELARRIGAPDSC